MSVCRSCGEEIRWVTTAGGKLMPVDMEPAEDGTVALNGPISVASKARVLSAKDRFGFDGLRYRSHFSTCKDANGWRRRA